MSGAPFEVVVAPLHVASVRVQVGIDEAEGVVSNSKSDAYSSLVAKDSSVPRPNLSNRKKEKNERKRKKKKSKKEKRDEKRAR